MANSGLRILLIEDDEDDYVLVQDLLSEIGTTKYALEWESSYEPALEAMLEDHFDLCLLDYRLGERTGLELLRELAGKGCRTPVIFLTGQGDYEVDIEAMKAGAADYLIKGEINSPLLERSIRYAIERRRTEEQLWQSQKIEAIGTLAGGIAHDFNNILAAIVTNTELALWDVSEPRVRENLRQVLTAGLKGRDLVKQILAFSRKSEKDRRVFSLSPLLKETFKLLRATLPTTIDMEVCLGTDSDRVCANPSQIQQIIINLCTNAADAMPEKGKIEISLKSTTIPENGPLPDADMSPGEYLVLSVKDTGSGMDEEVRKRIFEPFFTTKPPGRGTGLGLSVVYGIVKSHQGGITVDSEPGKGSLFNVYFSKSEMAVAAEKETSKPLPGGKERILFVDDEEIIVDSIHNMLKRLGYEVTILRSGFEALKVFSKDPSQFDLVITDQTMPLMTGEELSRELMRIRPDIPIILCTGYSDLISAEKATAIGIQGFILKPFTVSEGARLIRDVLDRKRSG